MTQDDLEKLFAPVMTSDVIAPTTVEESTAEEKSAPISPAEREVSPEVQAEIDRLNLNGDLTGIRPTDNMSDEEFVEHLRSLMTPVKISIKWPGTKRVLSDENKMEAAKAISADMKMADFSTRLYDMSKPRWKNVTRIRTKALNLAERMAMDYPHEPGIRLIRREYIPQFLEEIQSLQAQLRQEAETLNNDLPTILEEGRRLRGDAFRREDYPVDFRDEFAITCTFRSIEVAGEIRTLNPQLWVKECARVRESLESSIQKTEAEFLSRMDDCLGHLVERLKPNEDGTSKVFRETTWTNISELLEVLRKTGFGTKPKIQELSNRIQEMTGTTSVEWLRKNEAMRQRITSQAEEFRKALQDLANEEVTEESLRANVRQIRRREKAPNTEQVTG